MENYSQLLTNEQIEKLGQLNASGFELVFGRKLTDEIRHDFKIIHPKIGFYYFLYFKNELFGKVTYAKTPGMEYIYSFTFTGQFEPVYALN